MSQLHRDRDGHAQNLSPVRSLTAPQLLALASAARRDDGALVLPVRLKGKAAHNFVDALTGQGLVREVRAKADMPVCRRDAETDRSYALVITKLGRSSIPPSHEETAASAAESATGTPEKPGMLEAPSSNAAAPLQSVAGTNVAGEGVSSAVTNIASGGDAPRSGSKLAEVIALLLRENGASIEELTASTGWLPHTTRAALTGLRKRGYAVLREHADRGFVYRIEPVSSAKAA